MIHGLYYYENVLLESDLIPQLNQYEWKTSGTTRYQLYKRNMLGLNILPDCVKVLKDQVTDICRMILPTKTPNHAYFNECLVVQYEIGEGMAKHYAYPTVGDVAATFVFGGGATLLFSNEEAVEELYTRHNSLCILSEDAAWDWTSEMPAALYDTVKGEKVFRERRVTVTFRHSK